MATLTGNTVASTYESLIKVADNSTLNTSTTEQLSDGAGNNLPLKASQTTIEFTGNVNFNTATVQNLNTSDLTNDSGFITIVDVNAATASLSASLAADIASNLTAIESNDLDILGLDNQVSLLQSTASILTDSASLAVYDATSDFSTLTLERGDNTTFEVDVTPRQIIESVINKETFTLPKGTPVYVSGSTGNASHAYQADAGNASKIPASYVLNEDLTADEEGMALAMGFINGVDTSAFNAADTIYLAVGGGYTNEAPTGSAFIQRLGNVIKVDATNGSGVFTGAGAVRGLPNISEGYVWVGDADGVPQEVLSSSIVPTTALTASYVAGADVDGIVAQASLAVSALNASNADNVDIDNVSANTVYGFVFRDGDGSSYQQLYADTQADTPGWNPSTNTITAPIISASTTFSGDLDGNAATATTASYALTASYVSDLPDTFSQIVIETTSITLDDANYSTYLGKTIMMNGASALDVELDFTSAPSTGDEFYVVQSGSGAIGVINYGGSIFSSAGTSPTTRTQYSSMAFKYVGSGNWLIVGDIE